MGVIRHQRIPTVKVTLFLVGLAVSGCRNDAHSGRSAELSRSPTRVVVRLIDSHQPGEGEEDPIYHMEVHGVTVDTVRGVWTTDDPTVVGDSVLVGTVSDTSGERTAFFRYDLRKRRLDTIPMPVVFSHAFSELSISPDGQHVAWANFDRNGKAAAEIRAMPSGTLISRSPETDVAPSDGRLAFVTWTPQLEAIVVVLADQVPTRPWVQYRFAPGDRRWRIDSLSERR